MENSTMKGFIIAMLTAGVAMLFAALLWPHRPPSAAQRPQQQSRVASTTDTRSSQLTRERLIPPAMPSQTPAPANPATTVSYQQRTQQQPKASEKLDEDLTPEEQLTIKQTATDSTSLRNANFPRTYISAIHVDLASPNHSVRLTWSGPQAAAQETGPFHSSPGRGLGYNNCDDETESHRADSNCTPKGVMHIQAFTNSMVTSPECRYVSWFDTKRGIAFHYYPTVPNYPASHGCVRLQDMHAAQLIHNNAKIGATEVTVEGTWKPGR